MSDIDALREDERRALGEAKLAPGDAVTISAAMTFIDDFAKVHDAGDAAGRDVACILRLAAQRLSAKAEISEAMLKELAEECEQVAQGCEATSSYDEANAWRAVVKRIRAALEAADVCASSPDSSHTSTKISEALVQKCALAAAIACECGCTIEGVRMLCNDPRVPDQIRTETCDCVTGVRAALKAALSGEKDADHG